MKKIFLKRETNLMDYKNLMKFTKELTVLYAEDDEVTADIIEDFFKIIFKKVISVSNGLDAVEEYRNHKIDLVILDIEMPLMNGIDACKKIKEIKKEQKIIFLTAFDEIDYLKSALDVKVDEYLLKPLDEDEFLEKIYDLIK